MAIRGMWTGAINFGMVSIACKLYKANEDQRVSFRQLCAEHEQPIKNKKWCPTGEHDVEDLKKGFEVSKDDFVVMEEADFDSLPLESEHVIEITEFVDAAEIPVEYVKAAYYIGPETAGKHAYDLLLAALQSEHRVGVGKISMRDRERLCQISAGHDTLLLTQLYWPDEVRDPGELQIADGEVTEKELALAKQLVGMLEGSFDPSKHHDSYREALMTVVNAKLSGEAMPITTLREGKAPVDLMAALKASIDAAQVA